MKRESIRRDTPSTSHQTSRLTPIVDRSFASTPEIRPSSRNNIKIRPIKAPSFAVGEYEGCDFQSSSRANEFPDVCVYLNRKKMPRQQDLQSNVKVLYKGITSKLSDPISLGCMTRSLYSAGLILYLISFSSNKKEADLSQALATVKGMYERLFTGRTSLPKNENIVRGLFLIVESLLCQRLYNEKSNVRIILNMFF